MASKLDAAVAEHLVQDHGAKLTPPKPDGRIDDKEAIASTDEDMLLIHSIYHPNCDWTWNGD